MGVPVSPDHVRRLRTLSDVRRDAVLERAAILIFDAGMAPDEADEMAWRLESGKQPELPGVAK
jgi:hypothetical protein